MKTMHLFIFKQNSRFSNLLKFLHHLYMYVVCYLLEHFFLFSYAIETPKVGQSDVQYL